MSKTQEDLERAKRLRNLREQTGLSRLSFSEQVHMSEHTLKALETCTRVITAQGARELCNIFSLVGVDVSFEFLYYGNETGNLEKKEVIISDNCQIQDEVMSFKKNNPSSIILKIQDSLMAPLFNKGDIVGGQKVVNENQFSLLNGQICIIEGTNGLQCLRRIVKCEGRKIICCTLNTVDNNNSPLIEEIEAFSIAQVTRQWHLSSFVRNLQIGELTEKAPNHSFKYTQNNKHLTKK
jgi:transcriptional regulator with XRE-family HTH domain